MGFWALLCAHVSPRSRWMCEDLKVDGVMRGRAHGEGSQLGQMQSLSPPIPALLPHLLDLTACCLSLTHTHTNRQRFLLKTEAVRRK